MEVVGAVVVMVHAWLHVPVDRLAVGVDIFNGFAKLTQQRLLHLHINCDYQTTSYAINLIITSMVALGFLAMNFKRSPSEQYSRTMWIFT